MANVYLAVDRLTVMGYELRRRASRLDFLRIFICALLDSSSEAYAATNKAKSIVLVSLLASQLATHTETCLQRRAVEDFLIRGGPQYFLQDEVMRAVCVVCAAKCAEITSPDDVQREMQLFNYQQRHAQV